MRILIFGAGSTGRRIYQELKMNQKNEIIGFLDNDKNYRGGEHNRW